ncbi:MAG: rhomboid family intramembrane serine protease [Coriobacteriia bacterium]|nr:rhomboid family intramembrane serine protease [Coriobacteriia bacterium]
MIPLRDQNPTARVPWITIALVATNVAVFAFEVTRTPAELGAFLSRWGAHPAALASSPGDPALWLTVLTSMFLHAGWLHLIGNMLYLWIFGNNIEDRFGPIGFIGFYLLCGAAAVAAQVTLTPGSTVPLVGASGAIAGVLGAYVLLYPRARVVTLIPIVFVFEIATVPAAFVIGFWFVLQLIQGLGSLGSQMMSGVAWWAHVGGFALGFALALPSWFADRSGRGRRKSRFATWR